MQERKTSPKPFQNSLSALAQFAMRETGADGCSLFRESQNGTSLLRQNAFGIAIGEDVVTSGLSSVVTYRMAADGLLAFSFQDESQARQARAQLDRIAASIDAVWAAAQTSRRYSDLASEVADLEARLMDSKIADRVRGFLGNSSDPSPLEAVTRHVEGVLRPVSTGRVLEQLSRSLEEEMEERRLTNRAKAILQSVHGMSEDQAHAHLRQTSRKTRRKLKDVAVDLIDRHPLRETAKQEKT